MAASTLKILREINNYSQEYIAEDVLGVSPSTYSRIEQNPSKITAEQANKLAVLYKVSVADLLSESTPTVTFQPKTTENTSHEEELKAIKEQNDLLLKQHSELMELVKALHKTDPGKK